MSLRSKPLVSLMDFLRRILVGKQGRPSLNLLGSPSNSSGLSQRHRLLTTVRFAPAVSASEADCPATRASCSSGLSLRSKPLAAVGFASMESAQGAGRSATHVPRGGCSSGLSLRSKCPGRW